MPDRRWPEAEAARWTVVAATEFGMGGRYAMIVVDMPRLFERPRHLVLAFLAGLAAASGFSARCYVDELEAVLAEEQRAGAVA